MSIQEAAEAHGRRPDDELMLAYQQGDRAAFDELYARYAKPIYNFLRRAADRPESADDLLQKTFLKLHAGRHQYQPVGPFRSWIFTLARNVLRDEARERRRRPLADADAFDERQVAAGPGAGRDRAPELELIVAEALAGLPLTQREVVVLSRYHGMSYAEIGELLGISEGAVKQRAFQAMRKLRRWLQGIETRRG